MERMTEWKNKATEEVRLPGNVTVTLQKPRIFAMASQGRIPNPLMGVATKLMGGKGVEHGNLKDTAQMIELYCQVCMVELEYDDVKDVINDDQMLAIFQWATSGVTGAANFRKEEKAAANNNDGGEVSEEAQ